MNFLNMKISITIILLLLITVEGRTGGFRGGGGGGFKSSPRTSSGSGGRYQPSSPSRPSYPTQKPRSSGGSSSPYGWSMPSQSTSHSSSPQNYGWSIPKTDSGQHSSTGASGVTPKSTQPSHSSSPQNYGWSIPKTDLGQHSSTGASGVTPKSTQPYGWQTPTTHSPPSYGWQQPIPKSNTNQRLPQTVPHQNVQHSQNSDTRKSTPVNYPRQNSTLHNIGPSNPSHITGNKYERGFSKGYDQGYQRGIQQSTKIHPVYYPQQSNFGYAGGVNSGYGVPSYGGISMFGNANNYGYPISNAYGYQTYGTGNHDFRNGAVLGVIGGYMLNSVLHPTREFGVYSSSSFAAKNPWDYSGAGYGSGYHYMNVETTNINYNYFNRAPKQESNESQNWVQCIAFDPVTDTTLTNPNCSCTATVKIDSVTNNPVTLHNCTTVWGHQLETTPITDAEVFDQHLATEQVKKPEKLEDIEINRKRMEVYMHLEQIVNMGKFTV